MGELSSDDLDDLAMQCEDGPEVTVGAPTLLSLIATAREMEERRWVPVTDRLPPRGSTVLFWCRDWLPSATPGVGKFGVIERSGFSSDVFTDETQLDQDDCGRVYPVAEVHFWQAFVPPPKGPTNGR